MWMVWGGALLVLLKWLEVDPVSNWRWWWILAPLCVAGGIGVALFLPEEVGFPAGAEAEAENVGVFLQAVVADAARKRVLREEGAGGGADGVLQVDGRHFREKRLMAGTVNEAIGNGFLKSLRDQHVAVVAQRAFFTCAMLVFHCGQAVGDVCVAVNARDFFD